MVVERQRSVILPIAHAHADVHLIFVFWRPRLMIFELKLWVLYKLHESSVFLNATLRLHLMLMIITDVLRVRSDQLTMLKNCSPMPSTHTLWYVSVISLGFTTHVSFLIFSFRVMIFSFVYIALYSVRFYLFNSVLRSV